MYLRIIKRRRNIVFIYKSGRAWGLIEIETVFYAGEKLAYPYMTNFFTAVLMATGSATMRAAILLPSIIVSISLVFGIFYLGIEFHSLYTCSLIALLIFCNLGGLGFTRLFENQSFRELICNIESYLE